MCEQGILDRGVSEGCDFRRPNTYEEGTPPPNRVRLPRTEEPRWREYGLFQAYTVGWKSRNEAKRKKITNALERPGSARGLPLSLIHI